MADDDTQPDLWTLIAELDDSRVDVRRAAIVSLAEMKDLARLALASLKRAAREDPQPEIRDEASKAIDRIEAAVEGSTG